MGWSEEMGVHSIKLRVNVHATEDEEKVRKALLEAIPEEYRSKVRIEREEYTGHYGNPILVLSINVENPDESEKILNYILSKLDRVDKTMLAASLEERVDKEGSLYFRLSKQDALQGRLTIYESDDVIRVKVGYSGRRKRALHDYERRLRSGGGE
ncbi:MAG: hypothetical protein F7C35_01155 [Desulfurococcales archaeon]|nr:hypothetical protein [Desulfurococcales archaeon]